VGIGGPSPEAPVSNPGEIVGGAPSQMGAPMGEAQIFPPGPPGSKGLQKANGGPIFPPPGPWPHLGANPNSWRPIPPGLPPLGPKKSQFPAQIPVLSPGIPNFFGARKWFSCPKFGPCLGPNPPLFKKSRGPLLAPLETTWVTLGVGPPVLTGRNP